MLFYATAREFDNKKKSFANGLKSCVYKVRGGNSTKTTATFVKPSKICKRKIINCENMVSMAIIS